MGGVNNAIPKMGGVNNAIPKMGGVNNAIPKFLLFLYCNYFCNIQFATQTYL